MRGGGGSKEGAVNPYAGLIEAGSTHKSVATESAKKALLMWRDAYFPVQKTTEEKVKFVEAMLGEYENFIRELNDAEISKAWDAFKVYMDQGLDQWDLFIEGSGEARIAISVKETFVLVCLAVKGKGVDNIYGSEGASKENVKQRLKILADEITRLHRSNFVCHTGVRHELVGTLSGVYPGFTMHGDELVFIQDHLIAELAKDLLCIEDEAEKNKIYVD